MKININNYFYDCEVYEENNFIIVRNIDNLNTKKFLFKLMHDYKVNDTPKKDRVVDFEFCTLFQKGIFKNCVIFYSILLNLQRLH